MEQRRKIQPEEFARMQQEAIYGGTMHQDVEDTAASEQSNGQANGQDHAHNHAHGTNGEEFIPPEGARAPLFTVNPERFPMGPPAPLLAEFVRGILLGVAAGALLGALIAYLARGGLSDLPEDDK